MNKIIRSTITLGLVLIAASALLVPASAQTKIGVKHAATPAVATSMSSMHMQAVDAVPPSISAIKLPVTFVCKHCGIKMTIKTPADWLKPCPACPCGTASWQCYPSKGK